MQLLRVNMNIMSVAVVRVSAFSKCLSHKELTDDRVASTNCRGCRRVASVSHLCFSLLLNENMEANVPGIIAVVVFYILILAVGIIAGRKSKSTEANADSEEVMVAGRNIGMFVGIFTMTGTSAMCLCYGNESSV